MTVDEIKAHLPAYLSADSKNALVDAMTRFPAIPADKFYTIKLQGERHIFQGDGIEALPIIDLPAIEVKERLALILSNTCDIAPENKRFFHSRLVYCPIINLEKYVKILREEGVTDVQIDGHIEAIKQQHITQIFYLPPFNGSEESIVFFDRVLNADVELVKSDHLPKRRIFSLSNFGHYLLCLKISFHFCRFQDKVDRDAGILA